MPHWKVRLDSSRGNRAPVYLLPECTQLCAELSMVSESASFSIAGDTSTVAQDSTGMFEGNSPASDSIPSFSGEYTCKIALGLVRHLRQDLAG